ncbi:MAG: diphthamide biosynthesis enzyme Dph2 [ANME-2 cluster archaeon]|nr:MAG: diphthamide biosynthesis enzyme Dph2 [ANME-2 cluster archaeon]
MNNISSRFDFDLNRVVELIDKSEASTVGLQFPEGFKRLAFSIAREIKNQTKADVIISGNPCYGACDIDMAIKESVDILFHFGHSELEGGLDNVIYIETPSKADIRPVVEKAAIELGSGTLGVLTTVQHVHQMEEVRSILESKGIICKFGPGDSRIKYPGQLLGCNFSAADVECEQYLYIGSGKFHPLGVAIATKRKVLAADPFTDTIEWIGPERILRIRYGIITKCLDAKIFGIIASTKIGQDRKILAENLGRLAEKHHRQYLIISLDNITPDALLQFKVDAFVNTACPRIAIDDSKRYNTPILTPMEFEIVLGERDWDQLVFDEIREDT